MDKRSIFRSAGLVALSTVASRIMGFARDIVVASIFGVSGLVDGFYVAFRIPNLFRRLVAEGALTISFIPVYTEYLHKKKQEDSLLLAQKTLSILIIFLFVIVGAGVIFSPALIKLFAPGFTDESVISITVDLNRIMFPYLFLVAVVAFCMGYLNSHKAFFSSSISPVLLNVGFISGALVFAQFSDRPIYGLAYGVIFGGILQLLLQIPYMKKYGFRFRFIPDFRDEGIRRIFRMILPALAGIAIYYINQIINTALASSVFEGAVSYLYYSDRLLEVVLGVFIVSIGNVILPEMSAKSAHNDIDGVRRIYSSAAGASVFMALPASAFLMCCGIPLVSVMFMRGQFSPADVDMTAQALFYAAMGLVSIALIRITMPVFYSMKNTRIPVITAMVAMIVNVTTGYLLMHTSLRHAGLTLSNTIGATVQIAVVMFFLQRLIGSKECLHVLRSVLKCLAACAAFALPLYFVQAQIDWYTSGLFYRIFVLALMMSSSGIIYIVAAHLLGIREVSYIFKAFSKIKGKIK